MTSAKKLARHSAKCAAIWQLLLRRVRQDFWPTDARAKRTNV